MIISLEFIILIQSDLMANLSMSPAKTVCFLIICSLIPMMACENFLHINELQNITYYRCMMDNGFKKFGLLVRHNQVGSQIVKNIEQAKRFNLTLQIPLSICRKQIDSQVSKIKTYLARQNVERFWLAPFSEGQCSWQPYSAEQNCQFFQKFIEEMRKNNLKADVISSAYEWSLSFKSRIGCSQVSNGTNLWWLPMGEGEQDHQPNFNSYKQIGGWQTPARKLYQLQRVCGVPTYLSYYK